MYSVSDAYIFHNAQRRLASLPSRESTTTYNMFFSEHDVVVNEVYSIRCI